MKKIICAAVFFAGAVFAEISVPPGATMEATVKTSVPVSEVRITRLVCNLSNAVPAYAVTFSIIGANGATAQKTVSVTQDKAAEMMQAAGYNLTNVLSAAVGAVQILANETIGN